MIDTQIRFCLRCKYKKRDDYYKPNHYDRFCPKCGDWLWSIEADTEGFHNNEIIEISDFDENYLRMQKKDMIKFFDKVQKIMEEKWQ